MEIPAETVVRIAELLGREPRGLEEVSLAHPDGDPMVIRVASLVDGKPFPTLFWLIDPDLCQRINRAESDGQMAVMQQQINEDPELQAAMRQDHEAHIRLRRQHMSPAIRQRLADLGFDQVLERTGIGGIADFSRIRCLHTWYAAHRVVPNTVGKLLDIYWKENLS